MSILKTIYNIERTKYDYPILPLEDPLISGIRKKLHLELPIETKEGYYLINNQLKMVNEGEVEEKIEKILKERANTLRFLIDKMLESAILNSSIFESNSYFIIQNGYLVIGRIKRFFKNEDTFEIKFYTLSENELKTHYTDKIYIGGTFLNLGSPHLPFGGLNFYIDSLYDQIETLNFKSKTKLKNKKRYEGTFFLEIRELVEETVSRSLNILSQLPSRLNIKKTSEKETVKLLNLFREMKHYLLELADEIGEFENVLRNDKEENFARYVTKFKKDVKNTINYLNFYYISPLSTKLRKK